MTVRKLISELKKMPQNLEVGTDAHDNSELELQGFINGVELIDFDKIRKERPDPINDMGHTGKMVVLHH